MGFCSISRRLPSEGSESGWGIQLESPDRHGLSPGPGSPDPNVIFRCGDLNRRQKSIYNPYKWFPKCHGCILLINNSFFFKEAFSRTTLFCYPSISCGLQTQQTRFSHCLNTHLSLPGNWHNICNYLVRRTPFLVKNASISNQEVPPTSFLYTRFFYLFFITMVYNICLTFRVLMHSGSLVSKAGTPKKPTRQLTLLRNNRRHNTVARLFRKDGTDIGFFTMHQVHPLLQNHYSGGTLRGRDKISAFVE